MWRKRTGSRSSRVSKWWWTKHILLINIRSTAKKCEESICGWSGCVDFEGFLLSQIDVSHSLTHTPLNTWYMISIVLYTIILMHEVCGNRLYYTMKKILSNIVSSLKSVSSCCSYRWLHWLPSLSIHRNWLILCVVSVLFELFSYIIPTDLLSHILFGKCPRDKIIHLHVQCARLALI